MNTGSKPVVVDATVEGNIMLRLSGSADIDGQENLIIPLFSYFAMTELFLLLSLILTLNNCGSASGLPRTGSIFYEIR